MCTLYGRFSIISILVGFVKTVLTKISQYLFQNLFRALRPVFYEK